MCRSIVELGFSAGLPWSATYNSEGDGCYRETVANGVEDLIRNIEKDWRERVVKSNLDLIVLKLLRSKPQWGYEVNIAIRDRYRVYLSAGTLYPLLHSLESEGYIQGEWEPEKRRGRRIYKITDSGINFLEVGERATVELARLMQSSA